MKPRFFAEGDGKISYAAGKERVALIILHVC